MALDEHRQRVMGIKVADLHDADLIGNRKTWRFEWLETDLEYADDMTLLLDNWLGLTTMLHFLSNYCKKLSLAISCKKAKKLAVLPSDNLSAYIFKLLYQSTLCEETSLLEWSLISSTWKALFKIIVE